MSEAPAAEIPIPDWIGEELFLWLDRLGVAEYIVRGKMTPAVEGEARVLGECTAQARYLRAAFVFSEELEADDYGRHVVAHEAGHVLLAELAAVAQHMIDQLPPRLRPLALEMWDDATDRTIERLIRAYRASLDRGAPAKD